MTGGVDGARSNVPRQERLPRTLGPPADAHPAEARLRGLARLAAGLRPAQLDGRDAVLLPVQPDPAAGRLDPLRVHLRRPAGGPADRRAEASRRHGAAGIVRLRDAAAGDATVALNA